MQADAEHQQDDADFRELLRQALVGIEAGRIGADRDTGEEVADKRRDAQAVCDRAEDKRQADADNDRRNQGRCMRHGAGRLVVAATKLAVRARCGNSPERYARLRQQRSDKYRRTMPVPPFAPILDAARTRHGAADLETRLPTPKTPDELAATPDERYLSEMSRRGFRAGLQHSLR